jgi:hypothetical protein
MFIEINQGIFVKIDEIEAVIDTSDSSDGLDNPDVLCKVFTANNSYPSTLPSGVILNMIEIRENKPKSDEQWKDKMMNILKQQTNMGG